MKCTVIGVGRMGRRHIYVTEKIGLDLVGVVDPFVTSLIETQDEFKLRDELLYRNEESLFKNVIPDCVIIASTADSHCELTCKAAQMGVKYILVEKPMATSVSDCELMIKTCEKYDCLLSVNHQMRFMDQYMLPKKMLNNDSFCGFRSMTIVAGNFGMSMNGTHYLEAFRYMADEDPYEVTAWFDDEIVPNPRGKQFEDKSGSLRVTTKSGKRFYMEISSDQGHGMEVIYGARNGHIHISELYGDFVSTVREEEFKDSPTTRYGMPAIRIKKKIAPSEVIDSSAQVLKALLENEDRVTGEQGLLAVKVLAAAYQSAENGSKPVKLDNLLDLTRKFPWA